MKPGDVLAGRFQVGALAGAGGMGAVYRGVDRASGAPVALKVMTGAATEEARRRFEREVSILAQIHHPAVVAFIAHGVTELGYPFLAMRWLEGSSLEQRLQQRGLTIQETLTVARRTAEALALAHAHGIVHRDIKPSNLFLVHDEPRELVVLDFGVARLPRGAPPLTAAGALLGTPGFMAPEQASGAIDVGPQADVFALGCVLYECLTGEPAFGGSSPIQILASLLLHNPQPLFEKRPELGAELNVLLARMLDKDPAARFAHCGEVLAALADIPTGASSGAPPSGARRPAFTTDERRLLTIVLALDDPSALSIRSTVTSSELARIVTEMRRELALFGGQLAPLQDGGILVTLASRGSAVDQAAHAAEFALGIGRWLPLMRVAIATGHAEARVGSSVAPVVERATTLVSAAEGPGSVMVDETTAALLEGRFEIERRPAGACLSRGPRQELFPVRRVLGKQAPFAGRDKELALLSATWEEAVAEAEVRAVILWGDAGVGKSRLCRELIERVGTAHDATIVVARADSFAAGGTFDLVRQLLRNASQEADPARLIAHFEQIGVQLIHLPYLLELAGVEVEHGPEARSVLADPMAARGRFNAAFTHWFRAIAARTRLLLVLEDLHWGDAPSLELLEGAARRMEGRPLMLLGTSRSDGSHRGDWRSLEAQTVRLGAITRSASRRIVMTLLNGDTDERGIDELVDRAGGNPFFLEELVRQRVTAGASRELPNTILAVLQARIEALDPDARRLLRAASIVGEAFQTDAVAAVVGTSSAFVEAQIAFLVEAELFVREGPSVHRFAHALLRDASYAMLTPEDEHIGHQLAAEWFARAPGADAAAIALHWERAGRPAAAVPWLSDAARRAILAGDLDQALRLADRGIAAASEGAALGELLVAKMSALGWLGRWEEIVEPGARAMRLVQPGSTVWFYGASTLLFASASLGRPELSAGIILALTQLEGDCEPSGPYSRTVTVALAALILYGQRDVALQLLARLERAATSGTVVDPRFELWLSIGRAQVAMWLNDDVGSALEHTTRAATMLESVGDPIGAALNATTAARVFVEIGAHASAIENAQRAVALTARFGTSGLGVWAHIALCTALAGAGQCEEACRRAEEMLASRSSVDPGLVKIALSGALLLGGNAERASDVAGEALAASPGLRVRRLSSLAIAAAADMVAGRARDALETADEGLSLWKDMAAGVPRDVSLLHLTRARALEALGRTSDACAAARTAMARLDRIEHGLHDEALRLCFRQHGPQRAATESFLARLERSNVNAG